MAAGNEQEATTRGRRQGGNRRGNNRPNNSVETDAQDLQTFEAPTDTEENLNTEENLQTEAQTLPGEQVQGAEATEEDNTAAVVEGNVAVEPTAEDVEPTEGTEPTAEDVEPTEVVEPTAEDAEPTEGADPTTEDVEPTEGAELSTEDAEPTEGAELSTEDEETPSDPEESDNPVLEDTSPLGIWQYSMLEGGGHDTLQKSAAFKRTLAGYVQAFLDQGGELIEGAMPAELDEDVGEFELTRIIHQQYMAHIAANASSVGPTIEGKKVASEWGRLVLQYAAAEMPEDTDGLVDFLGGQGVEFNVVLKIDDDGRLTAHTRPAGDNKAPARSPGTGTTPVRKGGDGNPAPSLKGVGRLPGSVGRITLSSGEEILAEADSNLTGLYTEEHRLSIMQLYAIQNARGNGFSSSGCIEGSLEASAPVLYPKEKGPFQDGRTGLEKEQGIQFGNRYAAIDGSKILKIGAHQVAKNPEATFTIYSKANNLVMRTIAHCEGCKLPRLTIEDGSRLIGATVGQDRPLCAC